MFFSNTHWPKLTAPFYSILFETSICQFNSSKFSPIMPDEDREHMTRDQRPFLHPESLQILQIPSSMMVLLLFSSPHSFSTGFRSRTGMAIAEAWFCAQWPIYFVVFEVCVWIIVRLEDQNIAHYKLSSGAFPLSSVVRLGSARLSSGRFAFPLQFSTALEWADYSRVAIFAPPLLPWHHFKSTTNTPTKEHIDGMVFFILGMWMFLTAMEKPMRMLGIWEEGRCAALLE